MTITSLEWHARHVTELMHCIINNSIALDDSSLALFLYRKFRYIDFVVDNQQWIYIPEHLIVE
jgi:hypothetical protein